MSLPSGWESRGAGVSEDDIKAGKLVAEKGRLNIYADMGENIERKTDEEVANFYLSQGGTSSSKGEGAAGGAGGAIAAAAGASAPAPSGWEERAKFQSVMAEVVSAEEAASKPLAGPALVKVAVCSLNQLAEYLTARPETIPDELRADFAAALGKAMNAVAKSR